MPDAVAALRQAADVVRAQIPRGELTVASVQRLLDSAEAVCNQAGQSSAAAARAASRQAQRRQEERRKWARIAKENEREAHAEPVAAE
jgi:spore cortex formation protein SpoVR/YcgB (stage V sporulation)